MLSRDYLSTKLWDLRMGGNQASTMIVDSVNGTKPIYSAQVTDYLERNLANLMDSDQLDDHFFLDVSPDGKHFATGAYNKSGHVIDMNATTNSSIACRFDQARETPVGSLKVFGKNKRLIVGNSGTGAGSSNTSTTVDKQIDLRKRVSLGAWRP